MKLVKPKEAKNILLVTSNNFPYGGAGANVLRLLTTGLVKTDRNVSVLLQRGKQYGKTNKPDKRKDNIGGVSYAYCGYLSRPENYLKKIIDSWVGTFIPVFFLIKRKLKNKIDCVMMYNGSAFESIPLLFTCKLLRIPIINQVVEWYEKETKITYYGWKFHQWWYFLFGMKVMNKYFDGLMVTSNFLEKYYIEKGFKKNKILILPNLVDLSFFISKNSNSFKKDKAIRIGYCGIPTRKDGINDLLLAFQIVQRKFPDSELLVIGDRTDNNSLIPSLKKESIRLGILDKVIFTGLVQWNQIPGLLHSCDILGLARPSGRFAEAGFPTKLGEYMACKKPVVITKVGDIPLYLKDKENAMLAEPDNPASVASAINFLIENPIIAKKIEENGYLWAKNKLDYIKSTQVVGKFLDMFME